MTDGDDGDRGVAYLRGFRDAIALRAPVPQSDLTQDAYTDGFGDGLTARNTATQKAFAKYGYRPVTKRNG